MSFQLDSGFIKYSQKKLAGIAQKSMAAVLEMTAEGATVPFIARYRKEKTGNLDEVQIRDVIEAHETWTELVKRKAFVSEEISKQGSMTSDLQKQIDMSYELAEIEELYRPFKKKKKTKAKLAQEAGLGPLADWIWNLGHGTEKDTTSLEVKAKEFINPEKQFATYEECLRGAQHILVEKLANNPELRGFVRDDYFNNGQIVSEKTKDFKPNSKFSMYAEFNEAVKSIQNKKSSHRYLAIRRGWTEGELKVSIRGSDEELLRKFEMAVVPVTGHQATDFLKQAAKAAFEVHVVPSVTNEIHTLIKDLADKHAIEVFAENVRKVLMGSPFGSKVVLGIDPGLKTGCKVALVDNSGRFISDTVMQILGEDAQAKAKLLFEATLKQIKIEAIAVGNGTAGRETESFVRKVLKEIGREDVPVVLVNESGASVYSASDVAREEFPNLDITVRGAISIARRLQDPLSELVKIEPKSIGVGQYQHDVNQGHLKKSLHAVVESCVNTVGVDVNTASVSLLQYVAGIGPGIAKNIVEHRAQKGLFTERSELNNVSHFSGKVFEQAAGFLRVVGGKIGLDSTGIHPERYSAVRDMLSEAGLTLAKAVGGDVSKLQETKAKWVELLGEYTYQDIVTELAKPARDPRDPFKIFTFREDIHEIKDLKEAMICPGIVTNVTNFGAFVDIGVHQDGLVHISHISHEFVADPRTVIAPGMQVQVKVISIDLEKKQIGLSMLLEERPARAERPARFERGEGNQRGGDRADNRGGAERGGDRGRRPQGSRDGGGADRGAGANRGSGDRPQQRDAQGGGRDGGRDQGGRPNKGRPQERTRPGMMNSRRDEGPRDDRGPRDNRDSRDNRGGQGGGRPQQDRRPQGSPFNNPFAALTQLKK
jgi:protein Tex